MLIRNNNICFLISSCENFCLKTIPKNFSSLRESGIEEKDIYYIIGGNTQNIKFEIQNVIYRQDNSFEFTAFLDVAENPERYKDYTHFFYMHDTSFVGKFFIEKLKKILENFHKLDNIMMRTKPSMSIGIYNKETILSQNSLIFSLKNNSNAQEELQKFKKIGVSKEDCLFPQESLDFCSLTSTEEKILNFNNVYLTNTTRRLKFYECLDFYKMQGNWSGFVETMNLSL